MTAMLNRKLLKQQNIDKEGEDAILALHDELDNIFIMMEAQNPEDENGRICLHEWAHKVEELEYRLQDAWGFPRSRDHHSWWYRVPHCTCPKLDNMDYFSTPYRIFTEHCPVHGVEYDAVVSKHQESETAPATLWDRFRRVMYALRQRVPS